MCTFVPLYLTQEGQACLDYGTVRVADSKQLPLVLRNNGKYGVRFAFTQRTALARELLTLVPDNGTIEPGKDVTVQAVFNQGAVLAREVTLVSAPDVQLAIIEPLTSNKVRGDKRMNTYGGDAIALHVRDMHVSVKLHGRLFLVTRAEPICSLRTTYCSSPCGVPLLLLLLLLLQADTVPIRVSVRAVFSRYAITPARGIIFGPATYGTSSKPRTFEICNAGDFAFDWSLANLSVPGPGGAANEGSKDTKKASRSCTLQTLHCLASTHFTSHA
jgi:hypothetical protein